MVKVSVSQARDQEFELYLGHNQVSSCDICIKQIQEHCIAVPKFLDKKGHNSKEYSFQSYATCLATAPCHDQVFQVWC